MHAVDDRLRESLQRHRHHDSGRKSLESDGAAALDAADTAQNIAIIFRELGQDVPERSDESRNQNEHHEDGILAEPL